MTSDQRDPNPMKCSKDITIYNIKIQEHMLFQLLTAIDDKYKHVKQELIKTELLLTVEAAYTVI